MLHQKAKLRFIFEQRAHQWISLPEILSMGIAQYNARIHELRADGMHIKNMTKVVDGNRLSWFMYEPFEFVGGQGKLFNT